VFDVSYESALGRAGFSTVVVENQGTGAAMARIEAARRLFPSIWINEATTRDGMEALGAYHAKIDEHRGADLGPDHDWASHAADAFGLMCLSYELPRPGKPRQRSSAIGDGGRYSFMG
jgi:phage terminase large subunit